MLRTLSSPAPKALRNGNGGMLGVPGGLNLMGARWPQKSTLALRAGPPLGAEEVAADHQGLMVPCASIPSVCHNLTADSHPTCCREVGGLMAGLCGSHPTDSAVLAAESPGLSPPLSMCAGPIPLLHQHISNSGSLTGHAWLQPGHAAGGPTRGTWPWQSCAAHLRMDCASSVFW